MRVFASYAPDLLDPVDVELDSEELPSLELLDDDEDDEDDEEDDDVDDDDDDVQL